MDTVFDLFEEVPYTFNELSRGEVYGDRVISTQEAYGVFKLRSNMIQTGNQELKQSASTLHIKPNEPFANSNLVGNGITIDGQNYDIIGQTEGRNFDTNEVEHYTLTLQVSEYATTESD